MIDINSVHTIIFDFDGVFTNNKVLVSEDGSEAVLCSRADGLGFDLFRSYIADCGWIGNYFILSKEANPVALKRASKLKLECKGSIGNKLEYINKYFAVNLPLNLDPFSGLVYLGNDLNDLPIMRRAKYAICPSDAHLLIKKIAYKVYVEKGGDGFVRAFIEDLIGIKELTKEDLDELISYC